jgi:hypothetical protein
MVTNAARRGPHPCAPRSFASWWLVRTGRRARVLLAGVSVPAMFGACSDAGPTLPADAGYVAVLTGANERPPRATSGRGTATFDVHGGIASYEVEVSDLTGPATLAHVLIGGRETVGIPVVRLSLVAPSGAIAKGTIDLRSPITFNNTTISGDSLHALFESGNAYVNVYTATFPGGEVRGQVGRVR